MKRKHLTKHQRKRVYDKCNGHCAYCGCELRIEDMQIDHVVPLRDGDREQNMLPACRSYNHYKDGSSLEIFRHYAEKMPQTLQHDSVTYKNAVRFGLVEPKPHKIKFYFEQTDGASK